MTKLYVLRSNAAAVQRVQVDLLLCMSTGITSGHSTAQCPCARQAATSGVHVPAARPTHGLPAFLGSVLLCKPPWRGHNSPT